MPRPSHSLIILLILSSHVVVAQTQKSIVPDINASGKRGDIAREMHARSAELFLRADSNQDYRISPEEASRQLSYISKKFSQYDKNKDNGLEWQEFVGHNLWPAPVHQNAVQKQ